MGRGAVGKSCLFQSGAGIRPQVFTKGLGTCEVWGQTVWPERGPWDLPRTRPWSNPGMSQEFRFSREWGCRAPTDGMAGDGDAKTGLDFPR
jgi:hypothetical protein